MHSKIIYLIALVALFNSIHTFAGNDLKTTNYSSKQKNLTIEIDNLESAKAPVFVTVYTQKNKFLSETDALKFYKFIPKGKTLIVKIKELSYGEYALAVYQDLNSDNECNTNLIGIPKEPYAFSNNYVPKLRAPTFDECKFLYNKSSTNVKINLIK